MIDEALAHSELTKDYKQWKFNYISVGTNKAHLNKNNKKMDDYHATNTNIYGVR